MEAVRGEASGGVGLQGVDGACWGLRATCTRPFAHGGLWRLMAQPLCKASLRPGHPRPAHPPHCCAATAVHAAISSRIRMQELRLGGGAAPDESQTTVRATGSYLRAFADRRRRYAFLGSPNADEAIDGRGDAVL